MNEDDGKTVTAILQRVLLSCPQPNCADITCGCVLVMTYHLGILAGLLDITPARFWPFAVEIPSWMRASNDEVVRGVVAMLRTRAALVATELPS